MDVEIIKIRGKDYLINFTILKIELFNPESLKQKNKYFTQNLNNLNKFEMPEKYDKLYQRLLKVLEEKNKAKKIAEKP